ncbi:FAD-binding oxidoreductase [Amantichitinum ursilacus]|uniref:Putative FAD-linked oxidoreductase n=1 Tax=Amantichitinum ursilacus TaxID=857265 RepID=A0A0N0GN16_9NEIS|nr:FAD-binding oxidoreductase [Amantichitinum ursilacus]KPC52040.1 putative FAD-linked oxidoreductase [Amantichitinum ursilacus]
MTDLLHALSEILDPAGILTGAATEGYMIDGRRRYHGRNLAVLRPRNTEEVAAIVKLCAAHGVPMVPQGGNTSLCGAATPDESGHAVVIALERMNRVLDVDVGNNTLTAEAGAIIADLQNAARDADRLFAADWGAKGSARVGGALGTNAGGLNVLRYGNMRDLTLGLEVVLADGRIWNGLRGLRKDNTGYDLKQLFIAGEGSLGIITRATFKLFPLPTAQATALVPVANPQGAVDLLRGLQHRLGDRVTSFELLSRRCWQLLAQYCPELPKPFAELPEWSVLAEVSDGGTDDDLLARFGEALLDEGADDAVIATSRSDAADFWALREAVPEAQKRKGVSIKQDIGVPTSAFPQFLQEAEAALQAALPGADIIAFGHLGDGNLHYNVFLDDVTNAAYQHEPRINEVVYEIVQRHGGTISAEHGIGQLKRDLLPQYRSEVELDLMRTIKHALDPHNLMNPGKLLAG